MAIATITTIAQLATVTNHAVSLLKTIGEKIKSDKKDVLNEMLELQVAMMDMQGKQQNILSDNAELRARVAELEEALRFKGELEREGNALYLKTDTEHLQPYCMSCWGYERKLIGLIITELRGGGEGLKCKICEGRKG